MEAYFAQAALLIGIYLLVNVFLSDTEGALISLFGIAFLVGILITAGILIAFGPIVTALLFFLFLLTKLIYFR